MTQSGSAAQWAGSRRKLSIFDRMNGAEHGFVTTFNVQYRARFIHGGHVAAQILDYLADFGEPLGVGLRGFAPGESQIVLQPSVDITPAEAEVVARLVWASPAPRTRHR